MNLRITDAAGLVQALDSLLRKSGEPVHAAGGWTVVRVGGVLFYHGHGFDGAAEVGGPYPTLGAVVRDAGRTVAASSEATPGGEPLWEVCAWADGFYAVWASRPEAPTRHETAEAALADAGL